MLFDGHSVAAMNDDDIEQQIGEQMVEPFPPFCETYI